MLKVLDPELRNKVVLGALWTAGLTFAAVVVWVMVLSAPPPLNSMFRPLAWIATAPAAVLLVGTIALYGLAYLMREDR